MNLSALAVVLMCALLAGCDLSPQPLPPTGATSVPGTSGTSSGTGATVGQPSSGSTASTGGSAGAVAVAPSGSTMAANGSADAGLALATEDAGSSGPLDGSLDSTMLPEDAAFDADAGDAVEDVNQGSDVASD